LRNPTLSDLVGGIQAVTLSDEEARRRHTQKTVLERKAPPTFDVLIEIQDRDRLAVHHDVATVVDGFLRGRALRPELRARTAEGGFEVRQPDIPLEPIRLQTDVDQQRDMPARRSRRHMVRIFPYAVNRNRLEQAIQRCRVPASLVEELDTADLIVTLKSQEKHQSRRLREAQARGVPLYTVRHNTVTQMEQTLRLVFDRNDRHSSDASAMREAEVAIREVLEQSQPVELTPQNNYLRRMQHQLAERYGLTTESKGAEPHRRVVIYPV